MDMKKAFYMPKAMNITGRTSTITNSFVNSIIPCIPPSEIEIKESLDILGLNHEDLRCAYCGEKATEWDHLRPLVENKQPTGYISEINNLVPACGKCNQSKGNQDWKKWITSSAKLSPKTKGVKDLNDRIKRLEDYEKIRKPIKLDIV
ncbi:MAG: HNH endonuclease, partial [Candidatus Methanoperedens sp.]|nr:HNH endonuclease [Candidatus Methanoperedens sp.]